MTDAPTKIVAIQKITDPAKVRLVLVQPDTFQSVPLSGAGIATLTGANALATYANNAAAVTGGLAVGALYKTATGEVRIVV